VDYGSFGRTFDSFVESPHNPKVAMRHVIIRRRGLVSSIVVAAFAVAMFADCVSAAQATDEHEACCAAMAAGCGPQSKAHSCCTTQAPRVDQSVSVHRITVAAPGVSVAAVVFDAPVPTTLTRVGNPARDRHGSHPPGVPPYLLDSLFRV
jgi:hypothetical protein